MIMFIRANASGVPYRAVAMVAVLGEVACGGAGAASSSWVAWRSPDGALSATFPHAPRTTWGCEGGPGWVDDCGGAAVLGFRASTDYSPCHAGIVSASSTPATRRPLDDLRDATVREAEAAAGGHLVSQRSVRWLDVVADEYELETRSGSEHDHHIARIAYRGDRLIVADFVCPDTVSATSDALRFFDSVTTTGPARRTSPH